MRRVAVRKVVMLIEPHHAQARATAADTAANAKHTVAATTAPGRAPGVASAGLGRGGRVRMFRGSSGSHTARCASGPCGCSAGGPAWFTSARESAGASSGCVSSLRGWEAPSSAREGAVIPGRVVSVRTPLVEDVAPTSSGASSMARRGWDDGNTALLVSTRRDPPSLRRGTGRGEGRGTRPLFCGCPCSGGAHRLFSQHRLVAQGAGRVVLETGTLDCTHPAG